VIGILQASLEGWKAESGKWVLVENAWGRYVGSAAGILDDVKMY
jgi:hypothetical protein